MAKSDAVWAIDIGQCALKALRCRAHTDPRRIVAEAFDYIEYPKILSQPGADPAELVDDALKQFLSRNSVRGDRVAISVSGQSGLARFIKLPPVEAKKIPDIVRYEARQQIPFDLNDVIWDYQRMGGGSEEEGFALETEIGLFAMKRDAVFRALEPFQKVGIEVDFVQLAPLALYNFVLFDQLTDLPPAEEYDPESPPDSVVLLALGTDATDLVVTNGFRVWQRSIPLGGNHFTKALTKELKLTFAKAEHLKRNAATAQDPKAVFQAMRPVFRDLLTELQRSIGYFTSIDRNAKISHVVALGNAMKLPGLRRYLSQSLGFEVNRLEEFRGLSGSQVLSAPAFKENSLCFGVCYGLALQGLAKAGLRTNLLPKEILKDRLVRQKKPWAVAAAAAVLLACGVSFGFYSHARSNVAQKKEIGRTTWEAAERQADATAAQSAELMGDAEAALTEFQAIDKIGRNLTGNVEGRLRWLELLRTINRCLPPYPDEGPPAQTITPPKPPDDTPKKPEDLAKEITELGELHVTSLHCDHNSDLSMWYQTMQQRNPVWYKPPEQKQPPQPAQPGQPPAAVAAGVPADTTVPVGDLAGGAEPVPQGPVGEGWVVTLTGYHFHNFPDDPQRLQSAQYVVETLVKHLQTAKVILPSADRQAVEPVSTEDLGISYPVLVNPGKWQTVYVEMNPSAADAGMAAPTVINDPAAAKDIIKLTLFDFQVQFCWQPKTPSERQEIREEKKKQEHEMTAQRL
jgi:type IV pilus assembly protein PilM